MNHTPTPWHIDNSGGMTYIRSNGQSICRVIEEVVHDASRIVACVNALAGISNEVLDNPMFRSALKGKATLLEIMDHNKQLLKAVEFAEYLANSADYLLAKINVHSAYLAECEENGRDANDELEAELEANVSEAFSALASDIYEFRKRVPAKVS